MDNGEEIPALNEDWTFAGAKLSEWIGGFMMFIMAGEFLVENMGKAMPLLVAIMFLTTFILKGLRMSFPDEERGVRNLCMVTLGFEPPGIPAPAALQPIWSGAPLRELDPNSLYLQLGLDQLFGSGPDPLNEEGDEEPHG